MRRVAALLRGGDDARAGSLVALHVVLNVTAPGAALLIAADIGFSDGAIRWTP